jgi:hypothetical protein
MHHAKMLGPFTLKIKQKNLVHILQKIKMVYSNANGCKHVALLIYDKNLTECIQEWCAYQPTPKTPWGKVQAKKKKYVVK